MGTSSSREGAEGSEDETPPPPPPGSATETRRRRESTSYYTQFSSGYQELVNAIIRPPRAEYEEEHLGPTVFDWHGRRFRRTDQSLVNPRGQRLACSHWAPEEAPGATPIPRPCLVYLHGNSSARVEALSHIALSLSIGITLFAFDFSGSGKSDGEYVSLGYWERDDLATVIAHLRASGRVSTIALWGRSMGSVTGLLHGSRDPSIACMVLDGAFADLTQLAEELVEKAREQGVSVPGFVVSIALSFIRSTVLSTAKFKLEDVSAIKHAPTCFIPALFVAGQDDDFVAPHHSQQLHAQYAGDKNLVMVEGDHNSARPRFLYDSAAIFLQNCMDVPSSWTISGADAYNEGYPPWFPMGYQSMQHAHLSEFGFEERSQFGFDERSQLGFDERSPPVRRIQAPDLDARDLGMTQERQARVQETVANVFGGTGRRDPTSDVPESQDRLHDL